MTHVQELVVTMLNVELSIILLCVIAHKDLLVIHSDNVMKLNRIIQLLLQTLVLRLHADQMLTVENKMEQHHVHAFKTILEILMKDVDQNVC